MQTNIKYTFCMEFNGRHLVTFWQRRYCDWICACDTFGQCSISPSSFFTTHLWNLVKVTRKMNKSSKHYTLWLIKNTPKCFFVISSTKASQFL